MPKSVLPSKVSLDPGRKGVSSTLPAQASRGFPVRDTSSCKVYGCCCAPASQATGSSEKAFRETHRIKTTRLPALFPARDSLVLTAFFLRLFLELLPQHSLYCSEFHLTDVTFLVDFSKICQQVTCCLLVVVGAIPKPSHHIITDCHYDQQNSYPKHEPRSRCGKKFLHTETPENLTPTTYMPNRLIQTGSSKSYAEGGQM